MDNRRQGVMLAGNTSHSLMAGGSNTDNGMEKRGNMRESNTSRRMLLRLLYLPHQTYNRVLNEQ